MATRRITVLEADETILFSDLPALIAEALHDDEVMQAMSRIELEAELSHMVDAGSLTVRNPFTLGPLAFKHGDVLANSVVTLDDMRPLLEAKGIKLHVERTWETFNRTLGNDFFPDGTCSYSQAAHEIAQAQGWNGDRESALNAEMASAINAGQLPTYDRHTGLRLPADGRREFMGLVTVDDVNGWLESRGALYRWVRPSDSTGVVTLLPPISRVLVDDAVTLVVNAMPYPFEVGQDGLTAIERAVDGMNGKKFLRACKSLDILPRNPHDPFAEYAGEEEQAVLFEITVDEFTRYAAAHGVVVRVADLEQAAQAGDDSEVSDVPPENETPYQRRARLLQWREQEEAIGKRGAHARTVKREKKINPSADGSNISKDIKKARQEREAAQRAGMVATTVAPTPNNPFGITKVIDGKRQD